ncbi:MAG: twin-arginine translocation signal domain-containing protein, partial [Pseudolabrys sp.]|nr:twin-arginine translocation signal domain-containing protein [Pseudolabrys sp.]
MNRSHWSRRDLLKASSAMAVSAALAPALSTRV